MAEQVENLTFEVTIKYESSNYFFRWEWEVDEIENVGGLEKSKFLDWGRGFCLTRNNAVERADNFINKLVAHREKQQKTVYRVPKNVKLNPRKS